MSRMYIKIMDMDMQINPEIITQKISRRVSAHRRWISLISKQTELVYRANSNCFKERLSKI